LKDFVWDGTNKAFAAYGPSGVDIVPIIPTQQAPELNDISTGAPFLVYNAGRIGQRDFWLERETCSYIIYDSDPNRIIAIKNYMVDLLKRYDWTARAINSYLSPSNFDFKSVWVVSSQAPQPATEMGGRGSTSLTVGILYSVANDGLEGSTLRV